MFFAIAPQQVALPSGDTLDFRVNPADTSLVEIHIAGHDGTHVLTFKRNGAYASSEFIPTDKPVAELAPPTEPPPPSNPLVGYKSVDDDAVRTDKP
jgi:hypothetical protein